MPLIQLSDVSKSYADGRSQAAPALTGISFDVDEGEFISIVGPSGCGKSTLLHTIAGFTKPSTGTVLKDGRAIERPGPDRAVMFQEYALYPWKTVLENVALGLKPKKLPRRERDSIARAYLDLVQLDGFEHHYPGQLSGGMKQRVSIARCLATGPDVILMDEPFSALDSLTRDVMQEEILKIWERERKTVILVTHSIDEAVFMSDRVLVMSRRPGRIKECIDIDLPRPRTLAMRSADPGFIAYRERLATSLRREI
ncbi:nitrate ABC transporter ATP-binding protein [Burkholderia sp. WAC0059]|uniref:ABC transporter ATP-binding protein n=1 Tax=Burkholderia sp. WAC0059 TaxID=2066022 RepID=UPI000C7E9953|nr:ABC transporter ATP-binding protein [Burkholderia sp. WAC0059]PLZ03779.1 nitrate ABC transporter ATP-binding protein [Burkholderia sp. WAC0059]